MQTVYRLGESGRVRALDQVMCRDENKELQKLVADNPELLVGDQIDPDEPRRWLQIKSEMPVSDPQSGSDRWSIDLLFVDQDAVLTMVECKRCEDTRSRREVIAQVLEYAANAHLGWTAELLRKYATESALAANTTLEEALGRLGPPDEVDKGSFFEAALTNLRKRVCRIILFLEAAPMELKTLVEFLNSECATVEFLLVEARMYSDAGSNSRVVAPALWGFTEQIRLQKQRTAEAVNGRPKRWTEEAFFVQADGEQAGVARVLREFLKELRIAGCNVTWGTGRSGTFNVRIPGCTDLSAVTVTRNGSISINFGSLNHSEAERNLRDRLARFVSDAMQLPLSSDYQKSWRSYGFDAWSPKQAALLEALKPTPEAEPVNESDS